MAEGIEFGDSGRPRVETMDDLIDEILGPEDDETTTPFVDIPPAGSTLIRNKEASLGSLTGDPLIAARRELLKTKVDAFLKVVADRDGLLPGPHVYDEFVLGEDGRALYLKDGLKRITWKNNSTRYRVLQSLGTADFKRRYSGPGACCRAGDLVWWPPRARDTGAERGSEAHPWRSGRQPRKAVSARRRHYPSRTRTWGRRGGQRP